MLLMKLLRSEITQVPFSRAGRNIDEMYAQLSVANNNPRVWPSTLSSGFSMIRLNSLPNGVAPGCLVYIASRPWAFSHSTSFCADVLLPEQSGPSRTICGILDLRSFQIQSIYVNGSDCSYSFFVEELCKF